MTLPFRPDGVPSYLIAHDRWVLWRTEQRINRNTSEVTSTKVPISYLTGQPCDVTDPRNWASFAYVRAALARSAAWDGPGFVLGAIAQADEVAVGLDFDACLDADDALADWVQPFLAAMPTCAERSPGGAGIKAIARLRHADLDEARWLLGLADGGHARKRVFGERVAGGHAANAQLFLARRYFAVTGVHWPQSPEDVALLSLGQVRELAALFGENERRTTRAYDDPAADDDEAEPDEAALRDKLGAAFLRNPRLRERWEGGVAGLIDTSRSGRDMSVLAFLVSEGFSKGETRAALPLFEHGKVAEEPARYFERMWRVTKAAPTDAPEPPDGWEEQPSRAEEGTGPSRPTIRVVAGERHRAADAGIDALHQARVPFYQRDGVLVRADSRKAKASDSTPIQVPAIVAVTPSIMGRRLGQAARWEKARAKGRTSRVDPPKEVIAQILDMTDQWPFEPLFGLITTPTLRPDGTLLTKPGYDQATGYVLANPPPMVPIHEAPTKADALDALALLNNDLLSEFPFVSNADRSVAMSMLLTPVNRAAMPTAPMHCASGPAPGTGKSYLADTASVVATGERCPVISVSPRDEETEKRLIGAALTQSPVISLDNVSTLLWGDVLCQMTERPSLLLRPLGTSGLVRIANTFTVFANGNNLQVSADQVRRTIQCRLDTNMEAPEERTFMANPVQRVLADRGTYVRACLIITRAYIVASSPGCLPPLPSYEGWSNLVRSALVWLGWTDPVETTRTIRATDPIRSNRADVFNAWAAELTPGIGYQTRELVDLAQQWGHGERSHPELFAALFAIAPAKGNAQQIDALALGLWLRRNLDTVANGWKLTLNNTDRTRPHWALFSV